MFTAHTTPCQKLKAFRVQPLVAIIPVCHSRGDDELHATQYIHLPLLLTSPPPAEPKSVHPPGISRTLQSVPREHALFLSSARVIDATPRPLALPLTSPLPLLERLFWHCRSQFSAI